MCCSYWDVFLVVCCSYIGCVPGGVYGSYWDVFPVVCCSYLVVADDVEALAQHPRAHLWRKQIHGATTR